jgi:tRNA G18 (ribose-2'-O)-methylase SpoU
MDKLNKNFRVSIVLDRLRSAHNTGNIFRIADAVGASEIIACGYTPAPPHPKLEKTAMGADKMVPCRTFETSLEAVNALRKEGYRQILAVESEGDSVCAWDKEYEFPLALVLGNEALGIAEETIKACDGIISLPMFGQKSSINVGNCAAVVLYSVTAYKLKRGLVEQ